MMKTILSVSLCLSSVLLSFTSYSQIVNPGDLIRRKAADKVNQMMEKKTDEAIDSVFSDKKTSGKKESNSSDNDSNENPQADQAGQTYDNSDNGGAKEITLQTYSKYDFVPGEKVLFYDDFSDANIGEFPLGWNTDGSAEVVTTNLFPGKWLKFNGDTRIWNENYLNLPENYTIEYDVVPLKNENNEQAGYTFIMNEISNPSETGIALGSAVAQFVLSRYWWGNMNYSTAYNYDDTDYSQYRISSNKEGDEYLQKDNEKYHMAISVQKTRVRVYQNEKKLFDLPKAFGIPRKVNINRLVFENGSCMYTNVRVSAGIPDTRSKLITEGKLISYGIYFDKGKDAVKPESYSSLKSIADVLKENPTVKINIVGHTDSDGNDADNLSLSKRRAVSVKSELVKTFGIEEGRIQTDGKGKTQPVAGNDNPSNKALNRRVEFIKL